MSTRTHLSSCSVPRPVPPPRKILFFPLYSVAFSASLFHPPEMQRREIAQAFSRKTCTIGSYKKISNARKRLLRLFPSIPPPRPFPLVATSVDELKSVKAVETAISMRIELCEKEPNDNQSIVNRFPIDHQNSDSTGIEDNILRNIS